MTDSSGWIGYFGDAHGRPSAEGNDHLTEDQRAELERRANDRASARGRLEAVIRVDVYESGEATPQVQFPSGSSIDPTDRAHINQVVALAAEALSNWR